MPSFLKKHVLELKLKSKTSHVDILVACVTTIRFGKHIAVDDVNILEDIRLMIFLEPL